MQCTQSASYHFQSHHWPINYPTLSYPYNTSNKIWLFIPLETLRKASIGFLHHPLIWDCTYSSAAHAIQFSHICIFDLKCGDLAVEEHQKRMNEFIIPHSYEDCIIAILMYYICMSCLILFFLQMYRKVSKAIGYRDLDC